MSREEASLPNIETFLNFNNFSFGMTVNFVLCLRYVHHSLFYERNTTRNATNVVACQNNSL